jgi:hypothetical protein
MGVADEDLRHRGAAVGALDHFGPQLGLAGDVDLLEGDTLAGQQVLRGVTVIAEVPRVDFDRRHFGSTSSL